MGQQATAEAQAATGTVTARGTARRELAEVMHPGWAAQLGGLEDRLAALGDYLRAEAAAGRRFLPAGDRILAAFQQPFDQVRVLIVGQDPYPTPGHPIGQCFSVAPDVRPLPASLQNIFREYGEDLGHPPPACGDLTPWTEQGVLLLNRVLTVRAGAPGSHRRRGWEEITERAIRALAARGGPLVAILWGRDARDLKSLLGSTPVIESAHPSPLAARSGFFGSRPFSRANALLVSQGGEPVDWRLP
jgi:uracil-DNA glycosylase